MNADDLAAEIQRAYGALDVDALGPDAFRVLVPSPKNEHDSIALGVERDGDNWIITDGGQLAYLLEDEFTRVVDIVQCSGAPFAVGANDAVLTYTSEDDLPAAVLSFAHYFLATPVVWHALECARRPPAAPVSVEIMAKETRVRIVERVGARSDAFVHLRYRVRGHGETYSAPLAIGVRGAKRPPTLVATFIDTAAPARSVTSAKHNALFMFNVVRDLAIPKFVVIRGTETATDHYADLYDPMNVRAISTENLTPLYEDAESAVAELVRL